MSATLILCTLAFFRTITASMLNIWVYSISSVSLVSLVSLIGMLTLSLRSKSLQKMLLLLVSFAAGALFGDAFIHLIPEAARVNGFTTNTSISILSGLALSFLIEKIIHWKHSHRSAKTDHVHPFAMMNLFGDGLHNFIDGLVIGGSYLVSVPVGLATTLAVVLHEIPQEFGDFGVLIHGGFSKHKALFFNLLTALTAVIGVVVALTINTYTENLTTFLIPFAAGGFIYIAGSDLIPELHKEIQPKKSFLQLIGFIGGILIMLSLLLLE